MFCKELYLNLKTYSQDYKNICVGNSAEADINLRGKAEGKTSDCPNCLYTIISIVGNTRNWKY